VRFEWDPAKHERNQQERGFGFDLAALIFEGETIETEDSRRDYGEVRMRAIGEADGVLLHVVFTDRDDVRRVISARIANRKEQTKWRTRR
jgi:uncharacterized DUF497 family protein